jgi:hypothetical protein
LTDFLRNTQNFNFAINLSNSHSILTLEGYLYHTISEVDEAEMRPFLNEQHQNWNRCEPSFILVEDNPSFRPFYALVTDVGKDALYFYSLFELLPGTHITITAGPDLAQPAQYGAIVTRCSKLDENKSPFRYRIGVKCILDGICFSKSEGCSETHV